MFVSVFLGSGDLDGLPKVIIIFLTFFFSSYIWVTIKIFL